MYATFIYIQYGDAPLHLASEKGHKDIIKQLLKAGAKPRARAKVSCMVRTELVYSSDIYPEPLNCDFHVANLYMYIHTCNGFCIGI